MILDWGRKDDLDKVKKLPRSQRDKCRHEWRKYIVPTPGGWPYICIKCGARSR